MEALGRTRLADVSDAPAVLALINESMAKTFRVYGASDVVYLIENCVVSICLLNKSDDIVGFLAAKNYPLIPSVHPRAWEEYLWLKYKATELNSRNTIFLHMLCWDGRYAREAVDRLLRSLFMHDAHLHYVAVVKSLVKYPLLIPGQSRGEASFRRLYSIEKGVAGDAMPCLCIADRTEVSPRLRVRRAVEEDNDDIVPIIERHSARLKEMYGEFYISELISRHPESERVLLVCEHKELAVGVMCLNTQVNYEALEEHYELTPFAGLRHLDAKPIATSVEESGLSLNDMCQHDLSATFDQTSMKLSPRKGKGKISSSVNEYELEDDPKSHFHWRASGTYGNAFLDYLQAMDDEEEELDYEIVNIRALDMRVPPELEPEFFNSYESPEFPSLKNTGKSGSVSQEVKGDLTKPKKSLKSADFAQHLSPEPRRYSGTPNAFLLELFAMHPDYDERYGFDILEVAYELFPGREYCVMCLPSYYPTFPLLQHFTFVTPYRCKMKFINESLYVAHINSVRGNVRVRPAEAHDLIDMADIMEHAPRRQSLIELFESSLQNVPLDSYIMLSENMPIGVVILGPLEDGSSVRAKYDLKPEPVRAGTDGNILGSIVSPVFEPHMRWFIREILRITRYTTVFWLCRLVTKFDMNPCRNLMSLAGHMVPCRPRLVVPNISGHSDLDAVYKESVAPFVLWYMERPLTWLPKVDVNNSIVVIGASRTGLAFLEALFMGPASSYLTFTNITLISEHGLPTVPDCLKAADTCSPRDGRYTDKYLKSVPFYYYVDVISAVVTKIDRKQKYVQLRTGGTKYYDTLVLTCGLQYQHPHYLKESLLLDKELQKGEPCKRMLMDNPLYQPARVTLPPPLPYNVMLVNSLYDANVCLRRLAKMISELKEAHEALSPKNRVIVYGDSIEAYSCVAALLELGLPSSMLCFVEAWNEDAVPRVNCFNNETIDSRVQDSISNLGVAVYRRCRLHAWRARDLMATTVTFITDVKMITLSSFAMFYYGEKAIDINAFKAITESGLVYDGGVVIGADFETNDPYVVAAGPCTKYSRRLRAERWSHKYYCSEDVGEALAEIFLKKLDPFVMANPEAEIERSSDIMLKHSSTTTGLMRSTLSMLKSSPSCLIRVMRKTSDAYRKWKRVRKFYSPIVEWATLPGPLYYLEMRLPGPEIPFEVRMCLPHRGHRLITDKNGNYFRLRLNEFHFVEATTCLSHDPFSPEVVARVFSMHEAFFHHLIARHKMGLISDLFEYMTQPWMSAMYQEMFDDLLQDIDLQNVGTIYDLVRSRFNLMGGEPAGDAGAGPPTDIPECGFGPMEAAQLGTFREIIECFVVKSAYNMTRKPTDIPTECGQTADLRNSAAAFWRTVRGDSIVMAHLSQYLHQYAVANPLYAKPTL